MHHKTWWSICSGIRWSVCSGTGGQFTPELGGQIDRFFQPYVKALYYGKPANSTPRKVVDNSFTYNLVMEFDSLEDLEAYGKLPDHLDAIKKYSPYWERMIVHDAVLQQVR
ncbi:hypothetical protein FK004_06605 [Flavobacterium kingsejongi]|uniref:Stress-response A/B barrel domain-containing protein n=1 Tax=Flavobacterium kingsejongi TaxID=1678728 RepID=A0A2S1LMG0_9FLAO|nr:hypothetical protein FK004_06605 [Flavobacterium kingsejongi]